MSEKRKIKKPFLRCLAYLPRDKNGDGGRCKHAKGHDGEHQTEGAAEWISFGDKVAEWLHPNSNGKDAVIAELVQSRDDWKAAAEKAEQELKSMCEVYRWLFNNCLVRPQSNTIANIEMIQKAAIKARETLKRMEED